MIQAIVFDFGNVIGFFNHRLATDRLAGFCEVSSEVLWRELFNNDLEDEYEAGRLSTAELLRLLRERYRWRCTDEVVAAAFGQIFWPNEETVSLIPRLKSKYRLVLGSNTSELHARQFLQQFADVLGHFHGLVLSYEAGVRKPREGFFRRCVELAGCPPEACLFIDDLAANCAGARACGLQTLHYDAKRANLHRLLAELGIDSGAESAIEQP